MGVMAEQAVMTTRRFMGFGWRALGFTGCGDDFDVIEDIVDGPDPHGLFLFLPGEGKAEDQLDFPQQFNGVDTVKAMIVSEVVVETRLFKLKILGQDGQDFLL
jgi:hypothetical protein